MTTQPLQRVKFKAGKRPIGWHDKEYNVASIVNGSALIGKTWIDRSILQLVTDEQKEKKPSPYGDSLVKSIKSNTAADIALWIETNKPTANELFTHLVAIKIIK